VERSEHTILHFLKEVVKSITFADSKFLSSLRLILTKPGALSLHLINGQRVRYSRMISIFFLANLMYFLVPEFKTFNPTLAIQMEGQLYSQIANIESRVHEKVASGDTSFDDFEQVFDTSITANSKLLLISIVPMMTAFVAIFCYRSNRYFSDYVTFTLELVSFTIFFPIVCFALVLKLLVFLGLGFVSEFILTTVAGLLILYFLIPGLKNFFLFGYISSVIRSLFLLFAFFVSITLYRWLLFEITFFSM